MTQHESGHVLISGAGPVGLCAALFLRQEGHRVKLIEQRRAHQTANPAVVLHPDSLRLLKDAGVYFDGPHEVAFIDSVAFYEGDVRSGRVVLNPSTEADVFAGVVPMSLLRQKLTQRLQELDTQILWRHRLADIAIQDDKLYAEVDTMDEELRGYGVMYRDEVVRHREYQAPRFLIGADGVDSLVRQRQHLEYEAIGEPKIIVAFAVDIRLELNGEMRVTRSAQGGVSSVWPLPGGGIRVNLSLPVEESLSAKLTRRESPTQDELHALLRAHVPWLEAARDNVRLVSFERLTPALAHAEPQHHFCLLGESAHRLMPLASHSLNLAVREAHDLASSLSPTSRDDLIRPSLVDCEESWRSTAEKTARLADEPWRWQHQWILPLVPAADEQLEDVARQLRAIPGQA